MRLDTLIDGLPIEVIAGDPSGVIVDAIATDSRTVAGPALFFARRGWHIDSHRFIPAALAAGAVALVVTDAAAASMAPTGVPVLLSVAEDRDLGLLCDRFFGEPTKALRVFGVTGTNGKTSVSYIVEHALHAIGERPIVIGTVTHRFGARAIAARNTTPDGLTIHGLAAEFLGQGATALVIEVSSHGAALERIAGVAFDCVGFTNLTPEHLDYHGDMDAYRGAKQSLFSRSLDASVVRGKSTVAVAWVDDPVGSVMLEACPPAARQIRVASQAESDIKVSPIGAASADGRAFTLSVAGDVIEGSTRLVGDHNLANLGIGLAMVEGVFPGSLPKTLASVPSFAGVPGRFERVAGPHPDLPPVFVDYAHTPDALERASVALRGLGAQPTTIVVGCGGDRDPSKRAEMGRIAAVGADHAWLTSDNPRSEAPERIVEAMLDGVPEGCRDRVTVELDRTTAIDAAILAATGPVMIAGKGHESTQEIGAQRFRLDDREEARRALVARRDSVATARVPLLAGWAAERVARACGGSLERLGSGWGWSAVSIDSRTVSRGGIFVAIQGVNQDGHAYVAAAIDNGAALVVVSDASAVPAADVTVVVVDDTTRALQRLAAELVAEARGRHGGLTVIALTGSNGKTTTKELVAAMLGDAALSTRGNRNNHLGLPLTVVEIAAAHRFAVLEMGANAAGDIATLVSIASPDVAVVTSIGAAHIEGFGGVVGVRRAKSEIIGRRPRALVLPQSEARADEWQPFEGEPRTFALRGDGSDGAELEVERESAWGPVTVRARGAAAFETELPAPGVHNASNLAAALLAVSAATYAPVLGGAELEASLRRLTTPAGRLEVLQIGGRRVINDAYNANPPSMSAALAILAAEPPPRVAVIGDMLELGDTAEAAHVEAGRIAARSSEIVVAVGRKADAVARGAGDGCAVFEDAQTAGSFVARIAEPGATVLLKGSRGIALEAMLPRLRVEWEEVG